MKSTVWISALTPLADLWIARAFHFVEGDISIHS
jgi:hypothetical protein